MPSSATVTAFYVFSAGTVIRSADVNSNFSNYRGHIIPIDPNTSTAATTMTYDLGSTEYSWRGAYFQYGVMYQNTAGSIPASPTAGSMIFYFKNDGKAYTKNPSGIETALGGGALVNTGTRAAPSTITAAGGLAFVTSTGARQHWYILGDTTTGTTVTANPQVAIGNDDGQELIITGRDDSRPVTFSDGNGLKLNGAWTAYADSTLYLRWDTSVWVEVGRNGI